MSKQTRELKMKTSFKKQSQRRLESFSRDSRKSHPPIVILGHIHEGLRGLIERDLRQMK
jgi:hypothetical protein